METKESAVKQYFFVIHELVKREIKRKYTRSYLGILWSVLNPLLSMAVMSMIFSVVFKRDIVHFPIYYLTGSIFWNLFTGATNAAMTALVDNKSLILSGTLPMEIYPMSRCITAFVNFLYSLAAYVLMLVVFKIPFTVYMMLILPYALLAFLFSAGIGYFLSILYALFGDVKHLYSILLTLLMYASALFYPVESTSPLMQEIIIRNPVYNYIACARVCILEASLPDTDQILRLLVWSIGTFLAGKWYYYYMKNKVVQKL